MHAGSTCGQPPIVSKPKCVIKSISYQRVFQNTHVPMHVLEILCFVSFDSAVRERNFSRSQATSSLHEWVTDLHEKTKLELGERPMVGVKSTLQTVKTQP